MALRHAIAVAPSTVLHLHHRINNDYLEHGTLLSTIRDPIDMAIDFFSIAEYGTEFTYIPWSVILPSMQQIALVNEHCCKNVCARHLH